MPRAKTKTRTTSRSSPGLVIPETEVLALPPGEPEGTPWLGVTLLDAGLNEGAEINAIVPDSPAAKSELEKGDVIRSFRWKEEKIGGGEAISVSSNIFGVNSFLGAIGRKKPGDTFTIEVHRGLEEKLIEVTLGSMGDAPEPDQGEVAKEKEPLFPYVVGSFKGMLPGDPKYDPAKDRMMIGFVFGNQTVPMWMPRGTKREEITPYDFLTDTATNKRQGQTIEPHGTSVEDLTKGIGGWVPLPPLFVWNEGMWLADAYWEEGMDDGELTAGLRKKIEDAIETWPKDGVPESLWNYWIVSGEGTPGNCLYRVYGLPTEIAGQKNPKHPKMWRKELQTKTWTNYGTVHTPATPVTPVTTAKAPTISASVRFRCGGCGHWYTQTDLIAHSKVCGQGDDADWAMMCHNECGCRNLDEACKPKPGFPRAKKVEEKTEEPATETEPVT